MSGADTRARVVPMCAVLVMYGFIVGWYGYITLASSHLLPSSSPKSSRIIIVLSRRI